MKKSSTLFQYFDSKKQFLQGFVNDRDKLRSLLNRSKELSQSQRILENIDRIKPEIKKPIEQIQKQTKVLEHLQIHMEPKKIDYKVHEIKKSVEILNNV